MKKLPKSFYIRDTTKIAKELLGKVLVHKTEDQIYRGIIVETEAYLGIDDRASHSFNNTRTDRTKYMYMEGGHAYIYLNYGIHHLFNVVTNRKDVPEAVLVRAVEIIQGQERALYNRYGKPRQDLTKLQLKNMANGPGKFTQAMGITVDMTGTSLLGDKLWLEDIGETGEIVTTTRIGIENTGEAREYPLRFYLKGRNVSKK